MVKNNSLIDLVKNKFSRAIGVAIWVLILGLSLSIIGNLKHISAIKKDIRDEKVRVAKMEKENQDLALQVTEAQSQEFIEKQIRNKLGLVQNGETVVVLPDVNTLRKLAPQDTTEADSLPDPNWKRWLKLFL